MINNPVLFSLKKDVKIKQLKIFFKLNRNKNCIIKFENNDNINDVFIKEIQKFNTNHKKTIVIISKNLTLDKFINIAPTFKEALDIIEIEEIERSLEI
ncbi:MAG: hypothetical protein CMC16_01120 [Flavobacteriaceae bacterium]|nr:hypothetical protein [Flavobacteriaceae bacterium]|tara:strand:+ start:6158 stop:6451 length:294 start_codon:yes stop_codon:yes gene_type:complete